MSTMAHRNKKWTWVFLFLGVLITLGVGICIRQFMMKEKPAITVQTEQVNSQRSILSGNWEYLDGVKRINGGLQIQPTRRVIMEQDGTITQKNPPINIAGTYVEDLSGDFTIEATIDLLQSNTATMQLYGTLPIIADEFRIDRESLSIVLTKSELIIKAWDHKSQQPIEVRSFPIKTEPVNKLRIERVNDTCIFYVNGQKVGKIQEHGIFANGKIWFGFDAETAPWLLNDVHIEKKNGGSFIYADGATVKLQKKNTQRLQELASKKRKDFLIGGAMTSGILVEDNEYAQIALNDFGSMTPENEMKMINLQPTRGMYTFAQADGLVHIAKANRLTVHGHTLVFGEANPPWLTALPTNTQADKKAIEQIMREHVKTVVTHYKKDILSWDVINEPLADYDEFKSSQPMREHIWYRAMGESYIITALETAHQANPEAILFINEYGLEADDERWDAMIALLKRLKPQLEKRSIPVNQIGIGFQSHVYERRDKINPSILKKHIKELAALGYITQVSELDVYSGDGDKVQADQYVEVLKACLEETNCVAWRIWIIADRYNYWKNEAGQIQQGKDGLYDTELNPRPARTALERYLTQ